MKIKVMRFRVIPRFHCKRFRWGYDCGLSWGRWYWTWDWEVRR